MGVEYLTEFANTLDIFFTGLSECGLLTKYSVQLQAALVDLDLILKFKNLIWQLIKSLQILLAKIPSQSAASSLEVGTQTSFNGTDETDSGKVDQAEELVVTCHPITLTAITDRTSFVATSDILSVKTQSLNDLCLSSVNEVIDDKIVEENMRSKKQDSMQKQDSNTAKDNLLQDIPSIEGNKNIFELKPMLVTDDDKECMKLEEVCKASEASSIVHIVVEAAKESATAMQENIDDVTSEADLELTCEECDQQFKSPGSLERHLQSHSGFCNMCNQVFNCVQTLQEHCRAVHEGAGCFMCTICNKRFMTKFSYTRHMESHRGKKGAVCDVCGKSFSRADYLQTHYTIHIGKRSFACSQCPRKFVRRIQLTSHEKTHSGIKDHICEMCNRGFARSDKLREHMLRHLNIKRYQCATCKRFYAEKRDLKTHLKVHTKV